MTQEDIHEKLMTLLSDQLGALVVAEPNEIQSKNLQDALGCTSLEIVSVQMAIEDTFSLKFATGHTDRGPIDDEWDALRSVNDLRVFISKWLPKL